MKILIQGRKNGYSVLYPTLNPTDPFYSYANDIQSISASNNSIYYDKMFYTLAFTNGGRIFTKYIIGDDVERGQLGEIGISVFISNTEILKGTEIKSLLDELINIYSSNYIFNHKIIEPKNGFDWILFDSLLESYKSKLLQNSHNFNFLTPGTKDPAFYYYKSDDELIELFDKPFQEEYGDYKQIYFIDYNLQGASNPLNVLKNSGVEVNPDHSNDYLYLNSFSHIPGLTINAYFNKQWNDRTGETSKNIIRSKWPLKISYERDKRCYEPLVIPEKSAYELSDFLEIRDNHINVKTGHFSNLKEIQKDVEFTVVDHNGKKIDNAKISCRCDNYGGYKSVVSNILEFKGPELIQLWKAEVSTGEYSGKVEFTPETDQKVSILVKKQKSIPINVRDEQGFPLLDFEVRTNLSRKFQRTDTLTFENEQIDSLYQIIVRKEDYKDKDIFDFNPYKENSIKITLIKKEKKTQGAFWTKLKTIFSSTPAIVIFVIFVFLIVLSIWLYNPYFVKKNKSQDTLLTAQQIQDYVKGNYLLLDTLNDYKEKWNSQEKNYIERKGKGWFGGELSIDSSKWINEWQPVFENIELAILKRNLINDMKFVELKRQSYSIAQESFKTFIEKIDNTQYVEVGQKLGDVSKLTLSEIVAKVQVLLESKPVEKEVTPEVISKKIYETKPNDIHKNVTTKPIESNNTPNAPERDPYPKNITSEIIEYIKGNKIKKGGLNKYIQNAVINSKIKESLKLCLKLWNLDGTKSNSYSSYLKELKNDNNLSNSQLIDFVKKMCEMENPKYIKLLPNSDQIRSLSDIEKKIIQ